FGAETPAPKQNRNRHYRVEVPPAHKRRRAEARLTPRETFHRKIHTAVDWRFPDCTIKRGHLEPRRMQNRDHVAIGGALKILITPSCAVDEHASRGIRQ